MGSLLAFLLTVTPGPNFVAEYQMRTALIQSGVPVGNHCMPCAQAGMASRVTFTESGWTCPNSHVGFLRSHQCNNAGCQLRDFVR
jgi:hypothetical protein